MNFWCDIDNAPHVPVLHPVIDWLIGKGHSVELTSRDYGQALALLELHRLKHTVCGKHAGANRVLKAVSLIGRNVRLASFAKRGRFRAVFAHGSRGPYVASRIKGIPLVQMGDYEHGATAPFMYRWTSLFLIPEIMPIETLEAAGVEPHRIRQFPGLKEELYVYDSVPDDSFLDYLEVSRDKVIVLVRPPASMAHYHVAEGDRLFLQMMRFFRDREDLMVILIPRTDSQRADSERLVQELGLQNVKIPDRVFHGPSLIYHADVVISGGGTMNREAACLGTPVYSIFRGPLGVVDKRLMESGRMHQLEDGSDLHSINFAKSTKIDPTVNYPKKQKILDSIGNAIVDAANGAIA